MAVSTYVHILRHQTEINSPCVQNVALIQYLGSVRAHLRGWSSFFVLLKSISCSDSNDAVWELQITGLGLVELPPQCVCISVRGCVLLLNIIFWNECKWQNGIPAMFLNPASGCTGKQLVALLLCRKKVQPEVFLHLVCMFSLCISEFSLGTPASCHIAKTWPSA